MSIAECEMKIARAKTELIMRHPFFQVMGLSLIFKNNIEAGYPREVIDTMATDGKHIFWDEEFVMGLKHDETVGVICHEILHVVWMHMLRRGGRHPKLWNIACDYVINEVCLDAKLKLPANGCFNKKYKNWPAEKVYEDLLKEMEKDAGGGIKIELPGTDENGNPIWGTFIPPKNEDGTPLSEAQKEELTQEIKKRVKLAAETAKAIGNLPAGLEGLIEAIGKPKVDWKSYIQEWVSGRIPDDYTWRRPNRRVMANFGIYMPRMQMNGAGFGVLSIDTSGSVSDNEHVKYVTEITGLIELCNPDRLLIVQHDAKVQKVDEWNFGDDFNKLKIKGRGGTMIKPVFKYVEEMDEQPDWMICFTDMGIGDYPQIGPDFPVLWAATGPDNAPFGTYIPLRDNMEV